MEATRCFQAALRPSWLRSAWHCLRPDKQAGASKHCRVAPVLECSYEPSVGRSGGGATCMREDNCYSSGVRSRLARISSKGIWWIVKAHSLGSAAILKFQDKSLRAQPGDYFLASARGEVEEPPRAPAACFREIYCVSRFARVSTTLGATARAGGHAACSASTFQGALETTGRSLGILRSRIQPVE